MERAIIMEYKALDVNDIQLDLENPRIKHYMEMYTNEITSEQIALALSAGGSTDARSSYKALRDSIKVNRGIINPIIVNKKNDGTMIVVEGNTRLQIYREFLKKILMVLGKRLSLLFITIWRCFTLMPFVCRRI